MGILKSFVLTIMLILIVPAIVIAAQSVTLDDFHFGEFRYKHPFNKDLADRIYGKSTIETIPAEIIKSFYDHTFGKSTDSYKDNVIYIYKTAVFITIDNVLVAALSTCEKGSSPRSMDSYSDESIAKVFGKPLNMVMVVNGGTDTEKTICFYGNSEEKKPNFIIQVDTTSDKNRSKDFNKGAIVWAENPILSFYCLSLWSDQAYHNVAIGED